MAKVVERHYIDDDDDINFSVYRQANSKRWYARFKIDEWYSKATGETDLQKAIIKAVQLKTEFGIMISNNFPVHAIRRTKKHLFKNIAELAIKRMEDALDNDTGMVIFETYIRTLRKYNIPFFGEMNIRETTDAKALLEFDAWRTKLLGRTPAKSSISTYNTAMSRVYDEAIIRKLITPSEIPVLSNTGRKGERRSAFTKDEYNTLVEAAKNWIEEGRKQVTRDIRLRLYYYIQIAAMTGIRTGTELDQLTWEDIHIREYEGKIHAAFTVRTGKTISYTGTREVIGKQELKSIVEEMMLVLRKGNKWKYTDPIFGNTGEFGRNFNKLIRELNMKEDASGERTLYSLRHSYITWELQNKTEIPVIAAQCGTSAEMIEKHYNHIVPSMFANQLSGRN